MVRKGLHYTKMNKSSLLLPDSCTTLSRWMKSSRCYGMVIFLLISFALSYPVHAVLRCSIAFILCRPSDLTSREEMQNILIDFEHKETSVNRPCWWQSRWKSCIKNWSQYRHHFTFAIAFYRVLQEWEVYHCTIWGGVISFAKAAALCSPSRLDSFPTSTTKN